MSGTRYDNVARVFRTTKPNSPPPPNILEDGELSVEQADPMRLWIGVPTTLDPTGRKLLFDSSHAGGGNFNVVISDTPPYGPRPGDLWWCSADGNLYIYYNDGTSMQWVIAVLSHGGSAIADDAPKDGISYGRKNGAWNAVLALSGDVLDGGNF